MKRIHIKLSLLSGTANNLEHVAIKNIEFSLWLNIRSVLRIKSEINLNDYLGNNLRTNLRRDLGK